MPATYTLDEDTILARLPWRRAAIDPTHASFKRYRGDAKSGAWADVTAEDHLASVVATARGLIASGVEAGDRVALMADTSYEWVLLDQAIWAAGAVTVPIYPSSSPSQVEWIVTDSGSHLLIVEKPSTQQALAAVDLPGVEVLVLDSGALGELQQRGEAIGVSEVERRRDGVELNQPASIVYTSGTTGRPKGCVITHRQLAAEVHGLLSAPIGSVANDGGTLLLFLPLAHVLARTVAYSTLVGGGTLGLWADFKTIVAQFAMFQPNLILGVPRVFEKVYDGIRAQARRKGPIPAEIFRRGEQVAIKWSRCQGGDGLGDARRPSPKLRLEHALFEKLLFQRVRAALGGECRYAISGGGALSDRLAHFFRGLGVPIYEGYGLTESCAAITVNGPGVHRIGTVGAPVPGNGVRISESGEIELRGNVVFSSYWKNPEATEAAFDDGWFRTGDLGALDDAGYLTITGRAKEILITAGGKNVVPGPMEDVMRSHPLISQAMVVGEGKPFVAALVTLDPPGLADWAKERELAHLSIQQLIETEELHAEVQLAVDDANAGVSQAEAIRKFVVLTDDFTEESGELTATHKLRRHTIEEARAAELAQLYR